MNIIMYHAPRIFKMAGFTTTEQQMIATLVVGLTFMFATFIAVFTVDKAGRKPTSENWFQRDGVRHSGAGLLPDAV